MPRIKAGKPHPSLPAKIDALLERVIELTGHQVLTGETVDRIDQHLGVLSDQVRHLSEVLQSQYNNVWHRRVWRWVLQQWEEGK